MSERLGPFKSREEAFAAAGAVLAYEDSTAWRRTPEEGRKNDSACSYHVFKVGNGGVVCNWRRAVHAVWFDGVEWSSLTPRARQQYERRMREARQEAEEEERRRHERAAAVARAIWSECTSAVKVGHAYLRRKGVCPVENLGVLDADEIRALYRTNSIGETFSLWCHASEQEMTGPVLVVPCCHGGEYERISSLEFISEEGAKLCLKGGNMAGACWMPPGLYESSGPVFIAEGIATAMSIRQVYGAPCVAARSCGNLVRVARLMRNCFPERALVIAGDVGNGEECARQAAKAVGGQAVFPDFSAKLPNGETLEEAFRRQYGKTPTDFNDSLIIAGALAPGRKYDPR